MDDTEKANYLAMFDGRHGARRRPSGYQRRDDGSHIFDNTPSYYEWWYFDAAFTNGYHVVVTYHYRNIFLSPMHPSTQVFIYRPNGEKIERFERVAPENASSMPDYCDLRMGAGRVRDTGDGYDLTIDIGGAGARLHFRGTVPPWKPGTGFNYKNEASGRVAGWVVPLPRAEVTGELFFDGETVAVEGTGYHDHNWGNYHCGETFSGWYWGRVHSDRYTVDYGWVIPRQADAPVVAPLLIAVPGEIVLSTNALAVDPGDFRTDGRTGQTYAGELLLRAEQPWVRFEMNIRTHRVLEAMPLPRTTDRDCWYFRFLADYDLDIAVDGNRERVAGELLHELMLL